jgi:translation initiation factor 4B
MARRVILNIAPVDGSNAYESTPQPQERRKLQLSPRSAAPSPSTGDESSPATDFADSPSIKSSPFGSAKPVDTVERVEAVAESTPAPAVEATTPVVKKAASNPFGSAKPIDMSAKEKEVEEKVEKAKQENALKVKEEAEKVKAAAAAAAAAVPVWGRATPAAGATSPTAEGAKSNEGRKSYNQSNGNVEGGAKKEYKKAYDSSKKSPAPASASVATSAPAVVKKSPAVVTKPALRKEGFSYSSMANTPSAVPTAVETKSVEAKSGLLTKLEETTI